ncbi:MAG: ATP-binding protein, partial [Parafilimonas sp.]
QKKKGEIFEQENDLFINHVVTIPVNQRRKYEDEILNVKRAAEKALRENEELIKAKKDLEEKYQQLDQAVNSLEIKNNEFLRFNYIFTHELREPLRKILLFSNMLQQHPASNITPDLNELIGKISKSTGRMELLISGLRDYIDISITEKNVSEVDVSLLLKQVIEDLKAKYKTTFDFYVVSEMPVVMGDYQQLNLLFFQLFENAIVHNENAEELKIEIENSIVQENVYKTTENKYKYTDFAKISITDNGKGIKSTYFDYIFEALKKLENSSRLGLGLAISKKIAENHNGFIRVKNRRDKGITFSVYLPLFNQQ